MSERDLCFSEKKDLSFRGTDMELKYRNVTSQKQCLRNTHAVTAVVSGY